jgi:hypothetical protein
MEVWVTTHHMSITKNRTVMQAAISVSRYFFIPMMVTWDENTVGLVGIKL